MSYRCSVLHISVFWCSVRYNFVSRWIQVYVGLSMGIIIHIFIPGEVLYYGYNVLVSFSYILFVKKLIKNTYLSY